jgi:hypothetical protein
MTTESVKKDALVRREFSAVEIESANGDMSIAAQIAQARAQIESRYIMAERHPRSWQKVEQDLVTECGFPDFALDKSAIYEKPVGGGKISGLGIRFAEVGIRCMTNVLVEAPIIFEDDQRIIRKVVVTDLESNTTHMVDIRIPKTVERREVKQGDIVLSSRTNSVGVTTYTIPASEDALYNKDNAAMSKVIRNGLLKILPKHIAKRCEETIREVRLADVKQDPDVAQRKIIESFQAFGVGVGDLEDFLEHRIAQTTPAEIVNLQALYGALRDGETTWRDITENAEEMRKLKPKPKAKGAEAAKERAAATEAPKPAPAPAKPAQAETKAPQRAEKAKPAPAPRKVASEPPPWENTPTSEPVIDEDEPEQAAPAPEPVKPPKAAPKPVEAQPAPAAAKPAAGKLIKGIMFPADMHRTSPEDGWSQEQYDLANTTIKMLGDHYSIEDTVEQMFGMDVTEMSSEAFDAMTKVLQKMVASRKQG